MKHLAYTARRLLLGTAIVINTVLLGINLLQNRDMHAALLNFLTCCVCWIGIYIINLSEQYELSLQRKKTGERTHDDDKQ